MFSALWHSELVSAMWPWFMRIIIINELSLLLIPAEQAHTCTYGQLCLYWNHPCGTLDPPDLDQMSQEHTACKCVFVFSSKFSRKKTEEGKSMTWPQWHDLSCLNIMIHKGSCCDDVLCQLLKVVYLCGEQQFNICPAFCLGPCTHSCPGVLFLWQLCGQTKLMSSNTYFIVWPL